MKNTVYEIKENKELCPGVFRMVLSGDCDGIRPGQFINITVEGFFLKRPISVCDISDGLLTIIFKVVGRGTEVMSRMKEGERLEALTGLGNGYDLTLSGDRPLLLGGGAGVPPLYFLAKELVKQGKKVTVVMGFNKSDEIFYEEEFKKLGADVAVTTVDGSYGVKGFVTDALPEEYSYVYTCGPEPMLKAVYRTVKTSGQFSFEERMGCGFGACMGCSCKTVTGYKRICKDGPVLLMEEILWEK